MVEALSNLLCLGFADTGSVVNFKLAFELFIINTSL